MNGRQIVALLTASFGAGTFAQAGIPELQQKLDELKNKPEPRDLKPGAMCYRMGFSPNELQEYICPACGHRTSYPRKTTDTGLRQQLLALKSYTELLAKITPRAASHGYIIFLDTTSLCSICGKNKSKSIILNIRKQDDRTSKTFTADLNDLHILDAFLDGKDRWTSSAGSEWPMKPELPRIRELLNLPETPQP